MKELKQINCEIDPEMDCEICDIYCTGIPVYVQSFYVYASSYGDVHDDGIMYGAAETNEISEDDIDMYYKQMDIDEKTFANTYQDYNIKLDMEAAESWCQLIMPVPRDYKEEDGPFFSVDQLGKMINSTFKSIKIVNIDDVELPNNIEFKLYKTNIFKHNIENTKQILKDIDDIFSE